MKLCANHKFMVLSFVNNALVFTAFMLLYGNGHRSAAAMLMGYWTSDLTYRVYRARRIALEAAALVREAAEQFGKFETAFKNAIEYDRKDNAIQPK